MKKSGINLYNTYYWFQETLGAKIIEAFNGFFEDRFSAGLISITQGDNIKESPVLEGESFYTCQISIKNKQNATLRATSNLIMKIFHDMLGSTSPIFELENLTELEQKILNDFFEFLMKEIEEYINKDTSKINPLDKENLNFAFFVQKNDTNAGKFCLSIPLNRLSPVSLRLSQNFDFEDFIDKNVYINLLAGYTKISLEDLKSLSGDDILILENSDIKVMTLKTETITKEIKVNPEPSIMLNIENEEEDEVDNVYKESYMPENKTMWDDIQIEVAAEFQRVKMTLGELKQISKGLVIDVGSILNNEISLLVENKAVAKGELVIINDKYGVRITEVFAKSKEQPAADVENNKQQPPVKPMPANPQKHPAPQGAKPAPQGAKPAPQPPKPAPRPQPQGKPLPPPPPKQAQGQGKDDFDYSNFEE